MRRAAVLFSVRGIVLGTLGAVLLAATPSPGQLNSHQMRERYGQSSKGDIDDHIKAMSSPDPNTRLDAVRELGASKDTKAIQHLIEAIGDIDVRVRAKSIAMLGDMRATDATPVLVQYLFLRTTEPPMKQLILAALGKIGDTRATRPIMEFLYRDLDVTMRGTAIFALGEIGDTESVETLSQIAEGDENPTVRRLASEAIVKVQQHQAVLRREVKGPSETFLEPKEGPPRR